MFPTSRLAQRRGTTTMEVLVSASVLLATIGILATVAPRLGRLWKATRNYQLATHELVNQLEHLTSLPDAEFERAIDDLTLSPEVANVLREAELAKSVVEDAPGIRIVLSLQWVESAEPTSVSMVAWARRKPTKPSEEEGSANEAQKVEGATP